jgi:hypothetical protein
MPTQDKAGGLGVASGGLQEATAPPGQATRSTRKALTDGQCEVASICKALARAGGTSKGKKRSEAKP